MTKLSNISCANVTMKKFLMVKFEEKCLKSLPNEVSEAISSRHADRQEKVNLPDQLPLAPNPFPPVNSNSNSEKENGMYQNKNHMENSKIYLPDGLELKDSFTPNNCDNMRKKKPMCRQFARGSCIKGDSCIFRHELDLKQLQGIYKFCWDFQNTTCTRQNCKHVHATIFEEQNYYRTGILPPKAVSHLKAEALQHSPPLRFPSSKDQPKTTTVSASSNTSTTEYIQICNMAINKTQINRGYHHVPINCASPKRKLNNFDPFSRSPHNMQLYEPSAKKCKICNANEIRLELSKNKLDEQMRSIVRLKDDVGTLEKKRSRLFTILTMLQESNKLSKGMPIGLNSPIHHNGENEKAFMEESMKMSLAKYFLGAEERKLSMEST